MEDVSEETLLTTFDKLVSEGVIVFGPHESFKIEDEGYPVSTAAVHTVWETPINNSPKRWNSASAQP